MGHEALAAVSIQMEPDDYIVPYYRDRGLILGRGMTTRQLGLEYFAKRNTGSGGRQMPSHYSNADLHLWSVPSFFFQAEDGIRDLTVTGVQTCALPICTGFFRRPKSLWRRVELDCGRRKNPVPASLRCYGSRLLRWQALRSRRESEPSRRSEERRVGEECRSRLSPYHSKKETY